MGDDAPVCSMGKLGKDCVEGSLGDCSQGSLFGKVSIRNRHRSVHWARSLPMGGGGKEALFCIADGRCVDFVGYIDFHRRSRATTR